MDLFKLECSTPGLSAEKKVSLLQEIYRMMNIIHRKILFFLIEIL